MYWNTLQWTKMDFANVIAHVRRKLTGYYRPQADASRTHPSTATLPLLTLSPSSVRKVQKVNDEIIVKPPKVRKA